MNETTEILRLVLAAILVVASVAKLWDRAGARQAMRGFGVPAGLARPLVIVLAGLEAAIAALLLPTGTARVAALAAAALFITFAIVVAAARLRGRTPDCHCFGRLHSAPAGWTTVVRNAALATAAVAVASRPAAPISTTAVVVFGVGTLVIGQAVVVFTLLRRYGRALGRIEELSVNEWSVELPQPRVEPAPQPATNGSPKLATVAALAGGVAATAAVAQAASHHSSALDPELKAIDAALKAAGPRLVTASTRSLKAIQALAKLRTGQPKRAKRTAARKALAAERREVLALRARIEELSGTGTTAHNVKVTIHGSLTLLGQSLAKREQAIGATPVRAQQLVKDAQRLFLRAVGSSAAAGKLLGRGS